MALNARQRRLYVHTVDLYKPNNFSGRPNNDVADLRYPSTPTYSNVKCYRDSKQEMTRKEVLGRTNVDNLFTVDVFHFDVAQDIGGNWYIRFNTSGHPDDETWFVTLGETMVKNWKANKQNINAKRMLKAPGVA